MWVKFSARIQLVAVRNWQEQAMSIERYRESSHCHSAQVPEAAPPFPTLCAHEPSPWIGGQRRWSMSFLLHPSCDWGLWSGLRIPWEVNSVAAEPPPVDQSGLPLLTFLLSRYLQAQPSSSVPCVGLGWELLSGRWSAFSRLQGFCLPRSAATQTWFRSPFATVWRGLQEMLAALHPSEA